MHLWFQGLIHINSSLPLRPLYINSITIIKYSSSTWGTWNNWGNWRITFQISSHVRRTLQNLSHDVSLMHSYQMMHHTCIAKKNWPKSSLYHQSITMLLKKKRWRNELLSPRRRKNQERDLFLMQRRVQNQRTHQHQRNYLCQRGHQHCHPHE